MRGGQLIREARRRAGLPQRQVAERLGTTQSVVARWEADVTAPTFDTVVRALRACGFELDVHLVPHEDGFAHDWSLARQNLPLSPEERFAQHQAWVEFGEEGRAGMAAAQQAAGG